MTDDASRARFSRKRKIARLIGLPFALAAYLVILFEEWVWRKAGSAARAFSELPMVARAESWLKSAPPWVAAMAFLIPGLLLFPAKLAGLWLISIHHGMLGAAVFIAAKAAGAAAVARVFALTEPALRSISWLNASLTFIFAKRDAIKSFVIQSAPFRQAQAIRSLLRIKLARAKRGWAERRMSRALRREKRRATRP